MFVKTCLSLRYFLYLLCFISTVSIAEQSKFSRFDLGDKVQFNYRWFDHQRNEQELTFTLPKTTLFDHFRTFKNYKPQYSQAYVLKRLKNYCTKHPFEQVSINFIEDDKQIKIHIKAKTQEEIDNVYQKLEQLKKQYLNEYLAKNNYHTFTNYLGETAIKPDHIKIAARSVADVKVLKAIILEKVSVQNIRKVTNYVLSFVQSIPYAVLESRSNTGENSFYPPLTLLYKNKGDCDSKVTLTAAILRALMPRIKMVIIYIDNHALLGIELLPKADEITLNYQGVTYVLAEPTGPALYPLGQLDHFTKQAVLAGHYSAETVK
jgi:hypothetical protein